MKLYVKKLGSDSLGKGIIAKSAALLPCLELLLCSIFSTSSVMDEGSCLQEKALKAH